MIAGALQTAPPGMGLEGKQPLHLAADKRHMSVAEWLFHAADEEPT